MNLRMILIALAAFLGGLCLFEALLYRRDLRLEWHRMQARRDCRNHEFLSSRREGPTPAWKALFDAGEKGFSRLARLLDDPDPVVSRRTVWAIDYFGPEYDDPPKNSPFIRYLREQNPRALVRYLIWPPYQHFADWRGPGWWLGPYWTGEGKNPIGATSGAINFCEDILQGRVSLACAECDSIEPSLNGASETRKLALNALGSMLPEGAVSKANETFRNAIDVAIQLLVKTAKEDVDPSVRLHALQVLFSRSSLGMANKPALLSSWLAFSRFGKDPWMGTEAFSKMSQLRPLLHLDHPVTLEILSRVEKRSASEGSLRKLLEETDPVPLATPRWFPLIDAAKRLLQRPMPDRALAALALARCNLPGSRQALKEALAAEKDNDTLKVLKASLLALGEAELEREVNQLFDKLSTERAPGPATLLGIVSSCLLLTGDQKALDKVVRVLVEENRSFLDLEEFVEGLPLLPRPIHYDGLKDWWKSHGKSLAWDAERRLWKVSKE